MNASLTCRVWLGMLALGLSACQPSGAQDPRPAPTVQDIASAYHPTYKAAAGTRSECLGRLAFEVSDKPAFEWGLPRRVRNNTSILGFSRILNGGQDAIRLANVAVVVAAGASPKTILEMQESVDDDKHIALHRFDENIQTKKLAAEDLAEQLETPELKADPKRTADYKQGILNKLQQAQDYERRKQNLDKDWHPTDWGLPQSTGYIAGPTLATGRLPCRPSSSWTPLMATPRSSPVPFGSRASGWFSPPRQARLAALWQRSRSSSRSSI